MPCRASPFFYVPLKNISKHNLQIYLYIVCYIDTDVSKQSNRKRGWNSHRFQNDSFDIVCITVKKNIQIVHVGIFFSTFFL